MKDEELQTDKMKKKLENHKYSEKSKYPSSKEPIDAKAQKGDLVYLKEERGKHNLRDPHLVVDSQGENVEVVKMLHSLNDRMQTKLSSKKITVNQTDIFKSTLSSKPRPEETKSRIPETSKPVPPTNLKSVWTPFGPDQSSSDDESSYDDAQSQVSEDIPDDSSDFLGNMFRNDSDELFEELHSTEDVITDESQEEEELSVAQSGHEDDLDDYEDDELVDSIETNTRDLYEQEIPNPATLPEPGDKIEFLETNVIPPSIVRASISTMFKTVQRKNPGWFNILQDGASNESSVELGKHRWKYLSRQADTASDDLPSATEPDEDQPIETNIVPPENNASEAAKLQHETAFAEETPRNLQLSMPFPDVQNLEHVLPLTSTPLQQSKKRLSDVRPRGLLPMEFEDSPLASTSSPTPSRFQQAVVRRARQVRKVLSGDKDSSDSN